MIQITSADTDSLRRRISQNQWALSSSSSLGISLGAAFELACGWYAWQRDGNQTAIELMTSLSVLCPVLRRVFDTLRDDWSNAASSVQLFEAPSWELWTVRRATDLIGSGWMLYQGRFKRALERSGFSSRLAAALSKALAEMADNIVQHSGADPQNPAHGVIGYHVASRWMSYTVADVGLGVLASLRRNPRWAGLSDSLAALVRISAHHDHLDRRIVISKIGTS